MKNSPRWTMTEPIIAPFVWFGLCYFSTHGALANLKTRTWPLTYSNPDSVNQGLVPSTTYHLRSDPIDRFNVTYPSTKPLQVPHSWGDFHTNFITSSLISSLYSFKNEKTKILVYEYAFKYEWLVGQLSIVSGTRAENDIHDSAWMNHGNRSRCSFSDSLVRGLSYPRLSDSFSVADLPCEECEGSTLMPRTPRVQCSFASLGLEGTDSVHIFQLENQKTRILRSSTKVLCVLLNAVHVLLS